MITICHSTAIFSIAVTVLRSTGHLPSTSCPRRLLVIDSSSLSFCGPPRTPRYSMSGHGVQPTYWRKYHPTIIGSLMSRLLIKDSISHYQKIPSRLTLTTYAFGSILGNASDQSSRLVVRSEKSLNFRGLTLTWPYGCKHLPASGVLKPSLPRFKNHPAFLASLFFSVQAIIQDKQTKKASAQNVIAPSGLTQYIQPPRYIIVRGKRGNGQNANKASLSAGPLSSWPDFF